MNAVDRVQGCGRYSGGRWASAVVAAGVLSALASWPCCAQTNVYPEKLLVSGAEAPSYANGTYTYYGDYNGKPRYLTGNASSTNHILLWWTGSYWTMQDSVAERFKHLSNTTLPPGSGWLRQPSNTLSALSITVAPTKLASYATDASLAIVSGKVMCVYAASNAVYLTRNLSGSTWTGRYVAYMNKITDASLASVGGRPAIAFDNDYSPGAYSIIKYWINAWPDGTGAWSGYDVTPQSGITWGDYPGKHVTMAIVNGKPAVAGVLVRPLGRYTYYELQCYFSPTADGSGLWTKTVLGGSNSEIVNGELAVVNGKPAVAYRVGAELRFAINGLASGLGAWTSRVVNGVSAAGKPSLAAIANRPAIVTATTSTNSALVYLRNGAANGSGLWSQKSVASGAYTYGQPQLAAVNGYPAIAYGVGTLYADRDLWFSVNANTNGTGAWTSSKIGQGDPLDMLDVSGQAAVVYSAKNGLMYLR